VLESHGTVYGPGGEYVIQTLQNATWNIIANNFFFSFLGACSLIPASAQCFTITTSIPPLAMLMARNCLGGTKSISPVDGQLSDERTFLEISSAL